MYVKTGDVLRKKKVSTIMDTDQPPAGEEESGVPTSLSKKELLEFWLQTIQHFYPDRQGRAYFVPPVFFKRVRYEEKNVAEQRVLVPLSPSEEPPVPCKDSSQALQLGPLPTSPDCRQDCFHNIPEDTTPTAGRVWSGMSEQVHPSLLKVSSSDMRSDNAQEQVLDCLKNFFEKQPGVFVISELNFQDYLGEKSYVESVRAIEHLRFPRPQDKKYMRKGDFDILVIHRDLGMLAGEIKSVGSWRSGDQGDDDVIHKVEKAAEQIIKSKNVVNHLMSDLESKPPLRMTLILPSVKRCRLQEILGRKENQKTLKQLQRSCQEASTTATTRVMLHDLDFRRKSDREAVVKTLEGKAENDHLYIISDEYGGNESDMASCYQFFLKELHKRVPHLHFWAAVLRRASRSKVLKVGKLTEPLRSSPVVQREVQRGFRNLRDVYPYSREGVPSPWDGPEVIRLRHEGKSHQGRWPTECRQCGRDIGEKLRELGVGAKEAWPTSAVPNMVTQGPRPHSSTASTMHPVNENIDHLAADATNTSSTAVKDLEAPTTPRLATTATPTTPETPAKVKVVRRPEPLNFRDVFVLTNTSDLQDDPESGHVNDVVVGMREAGMEVRVVRSKTKDPDGWKRDVEDTATAVTDMVTFSHMGDVSGLERKVVVWLPGLPEGVEDEASVRKQEDMGCLYAVSRCSVQAIMVDVLPETPT
ncbi:uncharacterized protein LOC112572399 isoform X2 [Pomacea canaliculata]|uniref:uncharacterized protein LOC112572399 isoform X2 n=1 Tax=Pomacea canaliculata TaxID=400727 RepID=UPI000D7329BE|nr:uncharacterized protein LOC112572399 isoform X2 [Pomacea canaliculata]